MSLVIELSSVVECRTRDWKAARSVPSRSGERSFFSRLNVLCCWLFFPYPLQLNVTAVARKRPRSFCQNCRWQVTQLNTHTPKLDPTKLEWADHAVEALYGSKRARTQLVSWCFEPGQPQRNTSGLKTNFTLSPNYSFHKPFDHKSLYSQTTTQILSTVSERKPRRTKHVLEPIYSRGHSTRDTASSRVTYFILRADTGTRC